MEEFMKLIKTQYETNLKNWEGKENLHELVTVCVEEMGEIAKDILEGNDPNNEIIDLMAVLLQIYNKKYGKRIMALIGSARFKDKFLELEKKFTFKGNTVLIPFWDGMTNKTTYTDDEWEYLMGYSYKKIDLADIVFVVNQDNYIGIHTSKEIGYSEDKGKKIQYLIYLDSKCPDCSENLIQSKLRYVGESTWRKSKKCPICQAVWEWKDI